MKSPVLAAIQISKAIGSTVILREVDATVAPGEITAIIGPSGSGKSTLLRIMALVERADTGTVSIDGTEYSFPGEQPFPAPRPWPAVSMVFQQLFLWPHLTLRGNILLASASVGDGTEWREEYSDLAARLAISDLLDRHPNEVSFGQRQRAALARALVTQPRYLLLDEVTSAQDVERVTDLLSFLEELAESGVGLCVVTHMIGFAHHAAQRVIFIDQGEVVESGTREILESPSTARLSHFLSLVLSTGGPPGGS